MFETGVTGIIYYKLKSNYPGDITKGCGLTGPEIDGNFHFLRGYDIVNGELSGDTLILYRVNGDTIEIGGFNGFSEHDCCISSITYSAGTLYVDCCGETIEVPGFFTMDDVKYDCTLQINENGELGIHPEILSGISYAIEEAVSEEKEARVSSIEELSNSLNTEIENRTESEMQIVSNFNEELNSLEQSVSDISDDTDEKIEAVKTWVEEKDYATNSEVTEKINNSVENFDTKQEVDAKISEALEGNATQEWVEQQGFLTDHQSLDEYAKTADVDDKIDAAIQESEENTGNKINSAVADVKEWADEKFVTEVPSLENYYTKDQMDRTFDGINSVLNELKEVDSGFTRDISSITSTMLTKDAASEVYARNTDVAEALSEIGSQISGLETSLNDYAKEADVQNEINSAKEEILSGLSEYAKTEYVDSKNTEEAQARESADTEIRNSVTELSNVVEEIKNTKVEAKTTEDIVISTGSPLYEYVEGIWDNDTIPSGTTFTEFVKKLFTTEVMKSVYYITTWNSKSYFLSGNTIQHLDEFEDEDMTNEINITVLPGTTSCFILLPNKFGITSVMSNIDANNDLTEYFKPSACYVNACGKCLKYTLYTYTWAAPTTNADEIFNVVIA